MKNDSFRSDIGLGFGERGGTPPPRIPRSTFWGISALNFLFYESFVATHPFQCLVPGFSGKKNNLDPVSFGKREDTGDEGG